MIITLIGMSNCGKTYWSRQLGTVGFKLFSCDDYIETRLETALKNLGFSGINDMAKWMGQPYERQYPQTSKKYLSFEKEALEEIIHELKIENNKTDIIIDTTGSVIYHEEKILNQLQRFTKIVLLDTSKSVLQEMFTSYIKNPKPVYWGDSFNMKINEKPIAALSRCYPKLLHFRQERYKKYANITLDYSILRKRNFTTDDFLKFLRNN